MTETTCATIATLIPVLLLAVALEGRGVHVKLRLEKWYTILVGATLVLGFFGMGFALFGLQTKGFEGFEVGAWFTWAFMILTGVCSFAFLLCLAVSIEVEAEEEKEQKRLTEQMEKTVVGRLRIKLFGPPKVKKP